MSNHSTPDLTQPFDLKIDVSVPMRDVVNLSTDIYLPKSGGPFGSIGFGAAPGMDAEVQEAEQKIFHDHQRPAHLILPVIPR